MKRKYQCFISSTFEDLQEERMACVNAILNADCIPAGMEYFKTGRPQKEIIEKWINESDIMILLLGGRYGSIDKSNGRSYTENEYYYAQEQGKPILKIVFSDAYLYRKAAIFNENRKNISIFEDEKECQDLFEKFKNTVTKNGEQCKFINSFEELEGIIATHIMHYIQEVNLLGGWVKYDPARIIDIAGTNLESISNTTKKQLLQLLVQDMMINNQYYNEENIAISAKLATSLNIYKNALHKYVRSYTRAIEVVLRDSYIEVHNTSNITFISENGGEYYINPWLHPGIECESYEITRIQYNGEVLDDSIIIRSNGKITANPFYLSDVISAKIQFSKDSREHHIQYETRYKVDYNRFFHEYVFREICVNFHLDIILFDNRTNKINQEYEMKWGMFTPHSEQDYSSREMLIHEPHRIVFNTMDLMLPGNGYIVTLNSTINK